MIDALGGVVAEYGLLAGGGVTLAWAGLWLRRAYKIAQVMKFVGLVLVLAGVGAIAGVVDVGRIIELVSVGFDVLAS